MSVFLWWDCQTDRVAWHPGDTTSNYESESERDSVGISYVDTESEYTRLSGNGLPEWSSLESKRVICVSYDASAYDVTVESRMFGGLVLIRSETYIKQPPPRNVEGLVIAPRRAHCMAVTGFRIAILDVCFVLLAAIVWVVVTAIFWVLARAVGPWSG